MRSPLAILSLGLLTIGAFATNVVAQAAPAYPRLASQSGSEGMCVLDGLSVDGGITLNGGFKPSTFEYTCGCMDWTTIGFGKTNPAVNIHTYDWGSNAQVWFNGAAVNTKAIGNALTNYEQTKSLPLATASNDWKVGDNLIQILVGCTVDASTGVSPCEYQYVIKCNKPSGGGGTVTGDPQFVGLRGQNYQVHGVSGEVYNIVSDSDLQYNSRFVFLSAGSCPVVHGRKQKGCWSHAGSYLGELGLKTRAGDKIHLVTGAAKHGFAEVTLNGKSLAIGESVLLADGMGSLSRNSTHLASVQVGNWDFAFENSDMFVNQRVRVLDSRSLRSHGLLGQTWREATYPNAVKYVQGKVDDYVIRDQDIFGDNFLFNAFN
jgi:hypothetical protein